MQICRAQTEEKCQLIGASVQICRTYAPTQIFALFGQHWIFPRSCIQTGANREREKWPRAGDSYDDALILLARPAFDGPDSSQSDGRTNEHAASHAVGRRRQGLGLDLPGNEFFLRQFALWSENGDGPTAEAICNYYSQ